MSSTWQIPFEAEHMMQIIPRAQEVGLYNMVGKKQVADLVAGGPGWTVMSKDGPVGAGGAIRCWKGLGEAWAFAGNLVYKYKKSYFKAVYAGLREISRAFDFHRVQAHVDTNFPESLRFCKALGFRVEHRLERYGPNQQDFFALVWFPKED